MNAPTGRHAAGDTGRSATSREPSPVVRVAVEHYPATLAAVPGVRTRTVAILRAWSVGPAAVDVVELVVAELTANAVKASPPGDEVAVRLTAADATLLVEVWDGGDGRPVLATPDEEEEGGRGLLVVAAVSEQTGWYAARTGGKTVWARLAAPLSPSATGPGDTPPTSRRAPARGPDAAFPVRFADDPQLLRRVADRLRALDDWQLPAHRPRVARPSRHAYQETTL